MINLCGLLLTMISMNAPWPGDAMTVTAKMDADTLEIGKEYDMVLNVTFAEGISASLSGVPAPIVQIDAPKSISLSGKSIVQFKDLQKNDFMQEPDERLLSEFPAHIKFKLKKRPTKTDQILFSVLAYVHIDESDYFIRQRHAIPLQAGAVSTAIDATESDWGNDQSLQIGDKAAPFALPRADGSILSLGKILGKQNIIVTTYRANW